MTTPSRPIPQRPTDELSAKRAKLPVDFALDGVRELWRGEQAAEREQAAKVMDLWL